jgi:hypothetical protein
MVSVAKLPPYLSHASPLRSALLVALQVLVLLVILVLRLFGAGGDRFGTPLVVLV